MTRTATILAAALLLASTASAGTILAPNPATCLTQPSEGRWISGDHESNRVCRTIIPDPYRQHTDGPGARETRADLIQDPENPQLRITMPVAPRVTAQPPVDPSPVPLPASLPLLLGALVGLGWIRRGRA